eukprot:scaffold4487_cov273-Chaetoceros_neogracile.AAC.54
MDLFTKLFGGSLGFEPLAFDTSGHNKVLPYRPSRAHMLQATGRINLFRSLRSLIRAASARIETRCLCFEASMAKINAMLKDFPDAILGAM